MESIIDRNADRESFSLSIWMFLALLLAKSSTRLSKCCCLTRSDPIDISDNELRHMLLGSSFFILPKKENVRSPWQFVTGKVRKIWSATKTWGHTDCRLSVCNVSNYFVAHFSPSESDMKDLNWMSLFAKFIYRSDGCAFTFSTMTSLLDSWSETELQRGWSNACKRPSDVQDMPIADQWPHKMFIFLTSPSPSSVTPELSSAHVLRFLLL